MSQSDDGITAERVDFRILLFSRAAGYAHASIPAAVKAIERLGRKHHFAVDSTTEPTDFHPTNLSRYAAILFLHTTGNVLPDRSQREALEGYIHAGGGFFGVHAAADMGNVAETWPFYRDLIGASFKGHTAARLWTPIPIPRGFVNPFLRPLGIVYEGAICTAPTDSERQAMGLVRSVTWESAAVVVEDPDSPMMAGWSATEIRTDEWYGFTANPRPDVHVIASVREDSYTAARGGMGPDPGDHPIAWARTFQGGRSVYTGMGHQVALWSDPLFVSHVLGGIELASGASPLRSRGKPAD